jgi:hypothetical protein
MTDSFSRLPNTVTPSLLLFSLLIISGLIAVQCEAPPCGESQFELTQDVVL